MTPSSKILPVLAMLAVTLAACGNTTPVPESSYNDPRYTGPGSGSLFGKDGLVIFGNGTKTRDQGGTAIGVNAYLWRAALDTLSFMPLASADPFGGVIITDWWQPPSSPGERFKATAYILGGQLRSNAVKISVFRQVEQGGQWVDAPVNPTTPTELEDKVLARARELRATATE
jgi:hypothetical protein